MAPKRSVQPPPPPSPVSSSEETSSEETSSGSGSEEEEIAHSPPPAAPKSIAPPPQKDQESEASDEDEDGEEEEETSSGSGSEEEEIAHSPPPAAPKSIAPPPQKDQESEASDEDEDGEEEGVEEEEEDEKPNHVIPSSATKNPPPPPQTSVEGKEEEEEPDDEMPHSKPAPNQEMEAKGARRRGAPFPRTWSTDDEFRILQILAAHRLEHRTLPKTDVLANALAGKLDNSGCSLTELQNKVNSLRSRYSKAVKKGAPPSKDHDRRLFDLAKDVWPSATTTKAAAMAGANGGAVREPDEMREMYPYLAEEVMALQKAHPVMFKRAFAMIDDSKACALDEKIKKQRHSEMKLDLRRLDLTREVFKTLMALAE